MIQVMRDHSYLEEKFQCRVIEAVQGGYTILYLVSEIAETDELDFKVSLNLLLWIQLICDHLQFYRKNERKINISFKLFVIGWWLPVHEFFKGTSIEGK